MHAAALSAARFAVRGAARVALRVQRASGGSAVASVSKVDASPVTIADLAAQAAVVVLLVRRLYGCAAVHELLRCGRAPRGFRLVAEEDAAPLAGTDAASLALLDAVVRALAAELPRDGFGGPAGLQWTGGDVRAALVAGMCAGGLAGEEEGEGEDVPSEAGEGSEVVVATHAAGGPEVTPGDAAAGTSSTSTLAPPRGYWVLDPIDGTKGFIRKGQWAVGLAYVAYGAPTLAVIACPALPLAPWASTAAAGSAAAIAAGSAVGVGAGSSADAAAGGAAEDSTYDDPSMGCLFVATAGGGATMEALFGAPDAPPTPLSCAHAPPRAARDLVLCESFETGHSDHATSAAVCAALGVVDAGARAVRIDSMAKYGLLARRDGDLFIRLPHRGYAEKVWDHAPGALLLAEAGGAVSDAHGQPLDFSLGRTLARNEGVVAAVSKELHEKAIAAVRACKRGVEC